MRAWIVFPTVVCLCLLLQTTLLHVLPEEFGVPDLLLVLCVYLGLHRHSVGGAAGAFILGYLEDSFSGGLAGLNAFAMCLVFLLVYLTSRRLWVDNIISKVVVVFLAAVVKTVTVSVLLALFLSFDGLRNVGLSAVFIQAALAASMAPALFALLARSNEHARGGRR
jgi:rod shape-determining protein MreD